MEEINISEDMMNMILKAQRNEITEYYIYSRLSRITKDPGNSKVLKDIGNDELKHYNFWKKYSGKEVKPDRWKIFRFFWIARILGLTFGIKLLEMGEERAQDAYQYIAGTIPEARAIINDEDKHEKELINLLEEEHLQYVGSVVLGLNDALVELTGTLAGLTFALRNTRLIALAGLITGIAASLSMAASEYLSTKSESDHGHALKSSAYTGSAYIITVIFLILPYLLSANYILSLGLTISAAVIIIFVFNYYISVAKDLNFRKRFMEMASISLGVALLSFVIGYFVRIFLGVEI